MENINSNSGLERDKAIIVPETEENAGVAWEYAWLEKNTCKENGGYKGLAEQRVENINGHLYDKMTVNANDGQQLVYYFQIDSFFGKL